MERARFFAALWYLRQLKRKGYSKEVRRLAYWPFKVGYTGGWQRCCLEN